VGFEHVLAEGGIEKLIMKYDFVSKIGKYETRKIDINITAS
jgi:hypothetical protein